MPACGDKDEFPLFGIGPIRAWSKKGIEDEDQEEKDRDDEFNELFGIIPFPNLDGTDEGQK